MPFINHMLEGAALVARQATSEAAPTSAAADSTSPSTTFVSEPSTTFGAPSTTTSASSNNSGGSSPLLFFVALGFGVVFTNLWIIVGVKYCFRYNARARQMRLAAEDGEPINMEAMPHPRRRRREKKLMSIDEVNEKFPMMKYKTWVASRALNGLPTRGGVDAPSRANSVRSASGAIAPVAESKQPATSAISATPMTPTTTTTTSANVDSTPKQTTTADTSKAAESASNAAGTATADSTTANRVSVVSADGDAQDPSLYKKDRASEEHDHQSDDDEDEHIDSALPPECVGTSGDTCAICIDTLEDDDDVRGLTCGHAFHAVCLDPWLTSRRACCPLCKADYYTPKPRAVPAEGDEANHRGQAVGVMPIVLEPGMTRHRANNNRPTAASWFGMRGPGSYLSTHIMTGTRSSARGQSEGRPQPQARPDQPTASRSNWISNLRPFRRRQDEAVPATTAAGAGANAQATPSQLEAGVRS